MTPAEVMFYSFIGSILGFAMWDLIMWIAGHDPR